MRNKTFFVIMMWLTSFLFLVTTVALSTNCCAATVTLEAVEDAFVCNDDWANLNFGAGIAPGFSNRAVGKQNRHTGRQIGRQLYKFELPTNAPGNVTSATLRLKVFDNFAGSPHPTAVYGIEDNWDEFVVTWNTQPAFDSGELDSVNAMCCGIVYYYDVTDYIQSQLSGGDLTISFSQRGRDETVIGGVRWWQRESDGILHSNIMGESPKLLLDIIPEPTNSQPVADAGDGQIVYLCAEEAAQIELDGSDSTDADGDELDYLWTWEIEGTVFDANGVSSIIELPVGLHTIELTVDDGVEVSEPNSCVIEVIEGIEVDLRVMPRVINRKSRMTRILAVVQLPADIDGDDIDGSFWLYPGEIEPRFHRLMTVNGSQKLFMVFDKSELMAAVPGNGAVVLEIEAQLISGRCLYGSDRIRIIRRGRGPKEQTGLRKGTRFGRTRVQNSR